MWISLWKRPQIHSSKDSQFILALHGTKALWKFLEEAQNFGTKPSTPVGRTTTSFALDIVEKSNGILTGLGSKVE